MFALPLWLLWPWGARVIGLPSLGYVDMFAIGVTVSVVFCAGYVGAASIRSVVKAIVDDITEGW